jgi:hypothetical protein
MQFKTWVQIIMGLASFGIWSYTSFMGMNMPDDYMQFVKGIAVGVAALALRDMGTAKPETKQEEVKQ